MSSARQNRQNRKNQKNRPKEDRIKRELFALQDLQYQSFQAGLIPNIDPDTVIGVRAPALKKLAKELYSKCLTPEETHRFLCSLPHEYYEENNLHILFLGYEKEYEECIRALNAFLPYVNNWATCDMAPPAVLKKHPRELLEQIKIWIADSHPYTVRYAIGLLMRFYLDEEYDDRYPQMVAQVSSEEYYVNMMRAWYFATALAKQYDAVLPYLVEQRLDLWTHNKAVQKAVESLRIKPKQKEYLKSLRRKESHERKR